MLPYIKAVAAAGVRVWVFRSVDMPLPHALSISNLNMHAPLVFG